MIAIYDGTFNGFLTAVFDSYEYRWNSCSIQKFESTSLFEENQNITTSIVKAGRVWKGIEKYGGRNAQNLIYRVFLSELKEMEDILLQLIQKAIKTKGKILQNPADSVISKALKINKKIGREKHRMDAFIRFRKTKDNIYFAIIHPDFNVLPLNISHFKRRYADQQWIIYDIKRNYGFYYDLQKVEEVHLELPKTLSQNFGFSDIFFDEDEKQYQHLWKHYFDATNISSRKNMKLHQQHVPKRYWKYLIEKQLI